MKAYLTNRNKLYKKVGYKYCWYAIAPLIALVGLVWILTFCFFIFSSYFDGSYDKCMKECVKEDQSNYDECALSTCDFSI